MLRLMLKKKVLMIPVKTLQKGLPLGLDGLKKLRDNLKEDLTPSNPEDRFKEINRTVASIKESRNK